MYVLYIKMWWFKLLGNNFLFFSCLSKNFVLVFVLHRIGTKGRDVHSVIYTKSKDLATR